MTTPSRKRILTISALWLGILGIWALWVASGPVGASLLQRRLMWHPFPNDRLEETAFAPVRTENGSFELVSFRDLLQGRSRFTLLEPLPPRFDQSASFKEQVAVLRGSQPDPSWTPTATLTELDSNAEGPRYEGILRYPDGSEYGWRYRVSLGRVVPLAWYVLRDMSVISLIPLAFLTWAVGLPIAVWAYRRLYRLSRTTAL